MRYTNLKCIFAVKIKAHTYVTQIAITISIQRVFSCQFPGSSCPFLPSVLIFFIIDSFSLYPSCKMSLFSRCFKISSLSLAFSSLIMLCFCFCYFVIAHRSPRLCSFFSTILFSLSSDQSSIELSLNSQMTFPLISILLISLSGEF